MRKMSQHFFMLLLLLLFSATIEAAKSNVSGKKNSTENNSVIHNIFTEEQPNIVIAADQPEFTIKLKSNPTTGYSWFLREYDTTFITPIKHRFEADVKKLIGAAGYEWWTFRIKPAGFVVPQQTLIRFIYARPWQSTDSATQSFFRITMQGK